MRAFRDTCGDRAKLKVILAVGELPTLRDVYKASLVAMMAGADFIKTSTGKEKKNGTMDVGLVMIRAIRDFHERTNIKASGCNVLADPLVRVLTAFAMAHRLVSSPLAVSARPRRR